MKRGAAFQYTTAHDVSTEGTVLFECSQNIDHWPWLELHPHDPIVVQSINYWVSVETGIARGSLDPDKWSALTHMEWSAGKADGGHPVRGVSETCGLPEQPGYRLRFFDAHDDLVHDMRGTGVMFSTRDFEAWRQKAKKKIAALPAPPPFRFAEPSAVGVTENSKCFVSPSKSSDPPKVQALVTLTSGFPPSHRYHSGSGDHVNSTHLADAARQFVNQLYGGQKVDIVGGEMSFTRYVELGYPFEIILDQDMSCDTKPVLEIRQADHPCARVLLHLRP